MQLESAALGLGATTGAAQPARNASAVAHADLDATVRFQCRQADRARFVDAGLFAAFPGLRAVELVTGAGILAGAGLPLAAAVGASAYSMVADSVTRYRKK
ncbi:DUF2796 domain-containing protein [Sphingomonas sp. NCPPB 2930]